MEKRNIIWMPSVQIKLTQFRSEHFTPEETLDFITEVILEIEALLKNPILSQAYAEEHGPYQGLSRIVIKNFECILGKPKTVS